MGEPARREDVLWRIMWSSIKVAIDIANEAEENGEEAWWSQFYQMPVIHIFVFYNDDWLRENGWEPDEWTDHTFSKAFSKSAIRSSGSSIPTESLTRPSSNPLAKRSSRGTSA